MSEPRVMSEDVLSVESIFGAMTGEPLVVIRWGERAAQLSPTEARGFALDVLECAEASVGDAFLADFYAKAGASVQEIAGIIRDFRAFRNRPPEE